MKVRNSLYPSVYHGRQESKKPSLTIPDQTMSLRTILDRYSRGMPLTGFATPVFNGEQDLPDFKRMDLTEIQEFRDKINGQLKEIKAAQARDMESAKAKAEQLQARLDEIERAEKAKAENQP